MVVDFGPLRKTELGRCLAERMIGRNCPLFLDVVLTRSWVRTRILLQPLVQDLFDVKLLHFVATHSKGERLVINTFLASVGRHVGRVVLVRRRQGGPRFAFICIVLEARRRTSES